MVFHYAVLPYAYVVLSVSTSLSLDDPTLGTSINGTRCYCYPRVALTLMTLMMFMTLHAIS